MTDITPGCGSTTDARKRSTEAAAAAKAAESRAETLAEVRALFAIIVDAISDGDPTGHMPGREPLPVHIEHAIAEMQAAEHDEADDLAEALADVERREAS